MAKLIDIGGQPVNRAEQEMIQLLAEKLPDHYQLIPNSVLRRQGQQPYECDAIVVAPHAVYIIEIKGWSGAIDQVNHNQWQLDSGRYVDNPLSLNDQKAKVLAGLLELLELTDKNGRFLRRPYVQSCLLVHDPHTVFHLDPELLSHCHTPKTIISYLCDPYRLDAPVRDISPYRHCLSQITRQITGSAQGRRSADRTYGNYRITETISIEDNVSTFLARHAQLPDERLYRVRSWHLSPYLFSEEERQSRLQVLKRSAEALLKVGVHPNLVDFKDFGQQGSEFYEVTSWSDRGTLGTALSHGKIAKLSPQQRIRILIGIATGLQAAQKQGVYHRSLNPSVILLGPDYRPRLGDFDRAFLIDASRTVYGSQYRPDKRSDYVPPELALTDYEVFDNTDIYSLGVIAFELFTMMLPSMMANALKSERAQIPDLISDELIALIQSMIAKDPAQRPENPTEVINKLNALLAILEPPARPVKEPVVTPLPPQGPPISEPEPAPPIEPILNEAREQLWQAPLIDALTKNKSLALTLYQTLQTQLEENKSLALDDLLTGFLSAEAAATALEEYLPHTLPSFYDELLSPTAPIDLSASSSEPETLPFSPQALLIVLDGITPFEVRRLCASLTKNRTPYAEYLWTAGATNLASLESTAESLNIAFEDPPELHPCQTTDDALQALKDNKPGIRLLLPAEPRPEQNLHQLLIQRSSTIEAIVKAALAASDRHIYLTATYGSIYLGSGLSTDLEPPWNISFEQQPSRVSEVQDALATPPLTPLPFRDSQTGRHLIGRYSIPGDTDRNHLQSGGLSIPERLLPLIHIRPS